MERQRTKLKLILWDFQGDALQWMQDHLDDRKYSIVGHLNTIDAMLSDTMACDWDYLLCFIPTGQEELRRKFDGIFARLGISASDVIYALDLNEWVKHNDLGFYLLKGDTRKRMELWNEKRNGDYVACTAEGVSYVASSSDRVILDWMGMYGRNWADEEMKIFHRLAGKYYHIDFSKRGYFIDIGANIGTTCIYFQKKLDENVNILAFEPQADNYRLLCTNIVLNGLDQTSIVENYGLSEKTEQKKLHINSANPGQNSILFDYGQESEEIQMVSLDGYLSDHEISSDEIKYIWIDTEGFEPVVLTGAQDTLKNGNIPVFMEFNPYLWNASGLFDQMMKTLTAIYTGYLVIDEVSEGKESVHAIDEIWQYREAPQFFQQDIFLIK